MTVDTAQTELRTALHELWLAVAELVLGTNEDQPEQGELAAAEHVAELALEIQGRVAQALEAVTAQGSDHPARTVATVERHVRDAGLIYWRDLRAHEPVTRLRGSTRRRAGAWPSWWAGVEQSLERCEEPLVAAGRAIGAAWQELAFSQEQRRTPTDVPRRSS